MHADAMLEVAREALVLVAMVSAPPLAAGLLFGLISALLQATTQIQESVLAVVPKLAAAMLALAGCGPWMASELVGFAARLLWLIPEAAR